MLLASDSMPKSSRRALRRGVDLAAEIIAASGDAPVSGRVRDLSPYGARIDVDAPLAPGDEVVVCFRPPNWPSGRELTAFGEVTRVLTDPVRDGMGRVGVGVEFWRLEGDERIALEDALRGVPPPLPTV